MNTSENDAALNNYIVASIGDWNLINFERYVGGVRGKWYFVDEPEALSATLKSVENPRYIFFLHWNWIVPKSVWEKFECVCFHMTDVPYGRGGSPLQNLIIRGHKETKLTALRMVAEIDAGPVYTKRALSLEGTAHEIYVRASELSFKIITWMIDHEPHPVAQCGEPVIFNRRKPRESLLPEGLGVSDMYDFVRMLDAPGYPHAFIEHGDFILEFTEASIDSNELTANVRFRMKGKN